MLNKDEVTEDGIHIGITGPPVSKEDGGARHNDVTVAHGKDAKTQEDVVTDPDAKEQESLRAQIAEAESRALVDADVDPEKPVAATRTNKNPGNQR